MIHLFISIELINLFGENKNIARFEYKTKDGNQILDFNLICDANQI